MTEASQPIVDPDAPTPPVGVQLDYPVPDAVRVRVSIPIAARLLLACPRVLLLLGIVMLLVQAWHHHVFIAFWFFGLPFLRWLRGPRQGALLIGERALEVAGGRWLGGALVLPRSAIERIEIGRAGITELYRRALLVLTKDQRTTRLLVGISAEQAEFVARGLERWLAGP